MTLPASGLPISLNDIKTEYGAGGSRTLTTFYANANGFVSPGSVGFPGPPLGNGTAVRIPSSGNISPLNFSGAGVITGSAQSRGTSLSLDLPLAATWIAFKMVGAGGGQGGNDSLSGGNGAAGNYQDGILLLPEGVKNLVLFPGTGGGNGVSARGLGAGGDPGGGPAVLMSAYNAFFDCNGGRGSRSFPAGTSGAGGGGGGGSALWVTINGIVRLISIAGGGGGGGGGGRFGGTNVNLTGNNNGGPSWITNINNIGRSAGADGFGPDRAPTTSPPFLRGYGIGSASIEDGGGGGGGGGPFGTGGPIPTELYTDKSGVQSTVHYFDRTAGGGQSGLSVTNLTASGAFTWYTLNAETMTTVYSRANGNTYGGPGNGAGYIFPTGIAPARRGAISVAWTTQTAIPTNGLDFVPALVDS